MNSPRKLLALLLVAFVLLATYAPVSHTHVAAILIPLLVLSVCLAEVSLRRAVERCDLPSSLFRPLLASRAPPSR